MGQASQSLQERIAADDTPLAVENENCCLRMRKQTCGQLFLLVQHIVQFAALGFLLSPDVLRLIGVADDCQVQVDQLVQ